MRLVDVTAVILPARPAGILCLSFLFLVSPVAAQRGGLNDARPLQELTTAYHSAPGTGIVVLSVFAENSRVRLDRQALLKLIDPKTQAVTWQTTEDAAQGVFTDIPFGSYDVEISAVGYLTSHEEVHVVNLMHPVQMDVILKRDPSAINLDVADSSMPPKARKATKRAVSALKSGHLPQAQRQLDEAYKSAPSSPELNFLLGYLYFQKQAFDRSRTYLSKSTTGTPGQEQALSLLGRVNLELEDYPAATSTLERAVAVAPASWVAHSLLSDAYLHQNNYERAKAEAELAVQQGHESANSAKLILGQALLGLGREAEAIRMLREFSQSDPRNPAAAEVRALITEVEKGGSAAGSSSIREPRLATLSVPDAIRVLPPPSPLVSTWEPPSLDEVKPPVAAGVTCPSEKVIQASGERVKQLVDDVSRFAAVEDLLHQSLDDLGNPIRSETRKFNYVVSISEPEPGSLVVDEYRADRLHLSDYPDQIASSGFAALALVFHPNMRDDFELSCEGLGGWHGQATWLVHFVQRDDRPNRMHTYKVGAQVYPVKLKGRAWITADNFQIVRIESEMVSPMPQIQLRSEHQIVEYGPVPFARKNLSLWLPRSAEIYFDFRRHRYHRRHSFGHYMLFAVDSNEKTVPPKAKAGVGPNSL